MYSRLSEQRRKQAEDWEERKQIEHRRMITEKEIYPENDASSDHGDASSNPMMDEPSSPSL